MGAFIIPFEGDVRFILLKEPSASVITVVERVNREAEVFTAVYLRHISMYVESNTFKVHRFTCEMKWLREAYFYAARLRVLGERL